MQKMWLEETTWGKNFGDWRMTPELNGLPHDKYLIRWIKGDKKTYDQIIIRKRGQNYIQRFNVILWLIILLLDAQIVFNMDVQKAVCVPVMVWNGKEVTERSFTHDIFISV